MKNRKLFVISIVVILTLSLGACSGNNSSSSNTKNAAVEYMESVYIDETTGNIDIIETRDASALFEDNDEVESPYCIAFEDEDGNAYITLVFILEGEWKTEGVTRLAIASCDALLGP